jgi:pimeloyl-ACP methyl ester carboxylesterase
VRRYRCLIFDNRGCGKSDSLPGEYTPAMMAEDALALLDELDVERFHLCGMSLGGAIAQEITLKAPDRVLTLQLHGTWARTDGYARLYFNTAARLLEAGGTDLYYEGTLINIFPPDFFNEDPTRSDRILREIKSRASSADGLASQLHATLHHDTLDRLGAITAPTLITVGDMDMCLPPFFSRQLHAAIPGSELIIFPGGSHSFGIQDAATFNRVTLEWLAKHGG